MKSMKLCRITLLRFLVVLALISSFLPLPAYCQETEDSQIFISGFNAYQQKNYSTAIAKMDEVLQKYPDTPLRDMTLFWLARAHFKSGHREDAARVMSQFSREFPDSPLRGTVEEELLALATQYDKGVKPTAALSSTVPVDHQAEAHKAKVEQERLTAEKAEKERIAAVTAAENKRLAALKAEETRKAAEQAEQARLTAEKAEQQRIATAKAEQERIAVAKAEEARIAAVAAKNKRLAVLKAEQEQQAAEKAEQQRIAAAKAEQERIAAATAEETRIAAVAAENKRLAALKAEQERLAAVKAEQQRIASAKAEQEHIAAVKAEEARIAAAETKRLAALKTEHERLAAEKAEQQRIAVAKAEQERIAAVKAEEARSAAAAVENRRLAAEIAEQERRVAAKAAQERIAAEKAAGEAETARQAAASREQARIAAVKAEEQRQAKQRQAAEKTSADKAVLREKAIAQYKSVIQTYPSTKSAAIAAAKLQELGIAVAMPTLAAAAEPQPENAQVLRLEVAQFAGFEFNLLAAPQAYDVARRIPIPFEITNRGNGSDSFYLESGFPPEFNAGFASAAAPDQAINQTPLLATNETFKGIVTLSIPSASIDGLRITHPVKASSRFMGEATQSREIRLTAAAPLLRAVLKADKTQPLPGEKIQYRIAVLNVGSTAAQDVSFRLNFPPQLEPVDFAAAGFTQEMKAVLVRDGLQIKSGESREFTVAFLVKDDSLAGQELLCRAELVNNQLKTVASFVSNVANIKATHGIQVRSAAERIVIIPGQTVTVPFVVTNTGNVREKFAIVSSISGAQGAVIFHDLNRDGIRQSGEPVINEVGPLEPKEEASIGMEISTPRSAADNTEGSAQITFKPEGDISRTGTGSTRLVYSRPVLKMAMTGRNGRLKPGDVASFDLDITNRGSNLARVVDLQSVWPEQLELIAAEPANSSASNGNINWNFKELGAGEKRTIKVSFRVKPGTGVGTSLQVTNTLKYEDQLGNRY